MTDKQLAPVRLSGWDFATWRAASEDPIMRSTMLGLLLLESEPDWDRLVDRYERASRQVPILRQRILEGPVPWANPRLVVDPDFDLSFHLRRFRMPAGATWEDVLEECRRQSMTDFDRDRPLWKVTVLEGLPGGKAALISKLHHAVADGQGAIQLGAALMDLSPEGFDLGPMPRAPRGEHISSLSFAELMVRDNVEWVFDTTRRLAGGAVPVATRFLQDPGDAVRQLMQVGDSVLRMVRPPSSQLSPIMTGRSINYHYGAFQLPFQQIRSAAKAVGHTVNDAYLASVAEGMGEYHRRQGAPVSHLNLNMPISLRKSDDFGQNAVTVAHFTVNTDAADPVELMTEISRTVSKWRAEPALGLADQLAEISRFIPFEIIASAATASDVTASNVPGPPVEVYLAGAKVEELVPLPPPIGAAVFVALLTYDGQATIGIAMDDKAVADRDLLMECMRAGFEKVTGAPVAQWDPFASAAPAKKAPVKKTAAKRTARKAPAKKAPAKKTAAKRTAKKAPEKKDTAAGS
jgi:diacylglycerol O-acyltransferase / wax synthase